MHVASTQILNLQPDSSIIYARIEIWGASSPLCVE